MYQCSLCCRRLSDAEEKYKTSDNDVYCELCFAARPSEDPISMGRQAWEAIPASVKEVVDEALIVQTAGYEERPALIVLVTDRPWRLLPLLGVEWSDNVESEDVDLLLEDSVRVRVTNNPGRRLPDLWDGRSQEWYILKKGGYVDGILESVDAGAAFVEELAGARNPAEALCKVNDEVLPVLPVAWDGEVWGKVAVWLTQPTLWNTGEVYTVAHRLAYRLRHTISLVD